LETLAQTQFRLVAQLTAIADTETIGLGAALGRFLAEEIRASVDVPPRDVSLFDGYALTAPAEAGTRWPVVGESFAGDAPPPLNINSVMRIFTGSVLPADANAVIAQESVSLLADAWIQINECMNVGDGVRLQGADSRAGERILAAGTRLDAPQLGLLASVGRSSVSVVRKPRVAVFTTGNELVAPGESLPPGKIYNANHPMLVASLCRLGVDVLDLGCLPDEEAPLRTALAEAAGRADLVITSGGVSVGDADLVRRVVNALGRIDQWRVFLKPGKPLAFGVIAQTPFIGLPGNPVSTFITFFLFVRPVIRALLGADPEIDRPPVRLPLACAWPAGDRPEFVRVRRERGADGQTHLSVFQNQNSGLLSSMAWADGVALIPVGQDLEAGDSVDYFSFEAWYL
jgi:molybdopterin molybdotransferase